MSLHRRPRGFHCGWARGGPSGPQLILVAGLYAPGWAGGALADRAVVTPIASFGAPTATIEAGRPELDSRRSLRHRANVGSPHDASGRRL